MDRIVSKDLLLMRCVQNGSDKADADTAQQQLEHLMVSACEDAEKVGYKPCTGGELM